MRLILTALFLAAFTINAFAQLEKTIHQTFEVGNARQIVLDLYGEYETKPWAGSNVMTETSIKIFNASPQIFNHMVEQLHRYDIKAETLGEVLKLVSLDKKREAVRTKHGDYSEIIVLTVYIPEQFHSDDKLNFVRTN
jgi:hypothetical protein